MPIKTTAYDVAGYLTREDRVAAYLELAMEDTQGRPLAVQSVVDGKAIETYAGVPVIMTDKLVPSTGNYSTLLLKKNALALWVNPEPSIEEDKNILKRTKLLAIWSAFVAYRYKHLPGMTKGGVAQLISKIA